MRKTEEKLDLNWMNKNVFIKEESDITAIKECWLCLDDAASVLIQKGILSYMEYSFYQTYKWNSFIDNSYTHSQKETKYIIASVDGETKVIAPLLFNKRNKSIQILSGSIAGILNIVCPYRDEAAKMAIVAIIDYLKEKHSSGWDILLKDMPLHSLFVESLIAKGFSHGERESYHIPLESFENFDDYMASLGKNIYKNIRKSYNHLTTDDVKMNLDVYSISNPPSRWLLYRIWALYFKRKLAWKHRKETFFSNISCRFRAFTQSFFGRQSKTMTQLSESELYVLSLNGKVAAFMHVYNHNGHALMPKLAIDVSFSRYSPGILLVLESLKLMFQSEVLDFDMCRGDERYKREVGGVVELLGSVSFESRKA